MSAPKGRWRTRVVVAVVGAAAICLAAAVVEVRPRVILLALTVMACCALGWAVSDTGAGQADIDLGAPRRRVVPRWGLDPRFSRLSGSLREPNDPTLVAQLVHRTLVDIVDERLRSRHGIDRQSDPEAARAVMGDDLAGYIESTPAARRGQLTRFAAIVTRIEAL